MIEPVIIKKDPNRNEHLKWNVEDFQRIIDGVDLKDLTKYIVSLNTERWVPKCYWKNKGVDIETEFHHGEMWWAVYSYLVFKKILIIEDRYYGYSKSRTDKYTKRYDYYNPLEQDLYKPITERLVEYSHFDERIIQHKYTTSSRFTIGKPFMREKKLKELLK